jgi:hypothetical protein
LRRVALFVALAALVVTATACRGDDRRTTFRSTTTTSTTTTTTSTTSTTTATTLAFAPAPSGCDASALTRVEPRADRTSYTIEATLDLGSNHVTGTMRAKFTPDRDTDQVVLRLWPNGGKPAAAGALQSIADVTIDGKPVTFHMENPTTAFVASDDLAPGVPITLTLSFALRLPGLSDDRLSRSGNVVRLGSWLPLLAWEPIGHGGVGGVWNLEPPTSSNAEATTSVAADFDVRLATPAGLTALATGVEDSPGHWTAKAVPDWAASIADFTTVTNTVGDVPIVVGVEKSMTDNPTAYLSKVRSSLAELSRRYGRYPYPRLTLALTPGMRGGIEYPGHIMQGPDTNARTTPHEVAHQWFYSLVGSNQGRDPWLDEGLATWGEAVVNGTYASFKSRSIPSDGRRRLGEPMTFWDAHRASYYRSVYVQGFQALAAVGSVAAVDCALARYVATNAYRVATPASLTAALATVAPNAASVLAGYGAQRVT